MRQLLTILAIAFSSIGMAQNTERLYLSGTGADDTKTWDFYCSDGQNSGRWDKIEVPSCWELQGYGEYTYGRFYKTKGLEPSTETGRYRTTFTVPKSWKDKVVRIVFEGSMTDTEVWIDGRPCGKKHQGAFTEFSYDITPLVKAGKKHKLEVLVSKESANWSITNAERRADWWLFGGIYRPVYLTAMPRQHISHASIDARADGNLTAKVKVSEAAKGLPISLAVDGKKVGNVSSSFDEPTNTHLVKAHIAGISTWDPEHPNLHDVTFSIGDNTHSITERIGFRTIEFRRHDGLYLNGVKLVVKGTNRHVFHPEYGRTSSKAMSIADAKLLKHMNMNAVRCHYPSDRHFLEVCDSMGLLYMDELPGWQTRYDDTTSVRVLKEMIMRDVNHPSVYIWSNGNEGGWNTKADPLFAKYDIQQRKVVHPWADYDGIDTHHYPAFQTGAYRMHNGQNVFMPTEFLHGQYDKGQGAALEDFWSNWSRSPLFAGGFIWAFVDEAVRRTDLPTGKSKGKRFGSKGFDIKDCILDSDGSNGPDGCCDPYRRHEASVATIREVWSPIYIDRLHITPSFDGRIMVENRWLFTKLGDCSMKFRTKRIDGNNTTITNEGSVTLPDIAPGERGYAHFALPASFRDNDILEITALNPQGEEVCTWTAPIRRTSVVEQKNIKGEPLKVVFTDDGHIESITKGSRVIPLAGGPIPVGMKAECYKHTTRTEADGTIVDVFRYRGGIDSIVWRQTPDGRLTMDAVILNSERGNGYKGSFITDEGKWQIGLSFNYPEDNVDSVRWLGRGPFRVWRNRERGAQYGVWSKEYNNTVTGQYGTAEAPVYPEFKGHHADVRWMTLFGNNNITITTDTPELYVRLFTPEEPRVKSLGEMGGAAEKANLAAAIKQPERTMVRFPEGDISFLLSIPPIRSYKPLEQQGILSQPDNIRIKPGDEGYRISLMLEFE